MSLNEQYVLAVIVIFGAYYVFWVLRTLHEAKKIRHIREKGQKYDAFLANVDSNIHNSGNRFDVFVHIDTPTGKRRLRNYPKVKRIPYGVGMQVPVMFSPDYNDVFVFSEDWVLRHARPLTVLREGHVNWKKFALLTVIYCAAAVAVLFIGLRFFAET